MDNFTQYISEIYDHHLYQINLRPDRLPFDHIFKDSSTLRIMIPLGNSEIKNKIESFISRFNTNIDGYVIDWDEFKAYKESDTDKKNPTRVPKLLNRVKQEYFKSIKNNYTQDIYDLVLDGSLRTTDGGAYFINPSKEGDYAGKIKAVGTYIKPELVEKYGLTLSDEDLGKEGNIDSAMANKITKLYIDSLINPKKVPWIDVKAASEYLGSEFETIVNNFSQVDRILKISDIKKSLEVSEDTAEDFIIFSRAPIDVARMSDFDHITSCHSPPEINSDSSYFTCALADADARGGVIYLISRENRDAVKDNLQKRELFKDSDRVVDGIVPKSRSRFRLVTDGDGTELAVPTLRLYGRDQQHNIAFKDAIINWAKQQDVSKFDWESELTLHGGSYEDTSIDNLIMKVWGKDVRYTSAHDDQYYENPSNISDHERGEMREAIRENAEELIGDIIREELPFENVGGEYMEYNTDNDTISFDITLNDSLDDSIKDEITENSYTIYQTHNINGSIHISYDGKKKLSFEISNVPDVSDYYDEDEWEEYTEEPYWSDDAFSRDLKKVFKSFQKAFKVDGYSSEVMEAGIVASALEFLKDGKYYENYAGAENPIVKLTEELDKVSPKFFSKYTKNLQTLRLILPQPQIEVDLGLGEEELWKDERETPVVKYDNENFRKALNKVDDESYKIFKDYGFNVDDYKDPKFPWFIEPVILDGYDTSDRVHKRLKYEYLLDSSQGKYYTKDGYYTKDIFVISPNSKDIRSYLSERPKEKYMVAASIKVDDAEELLQFITSGTFDGFLQFLEDLQNGKFGDVSGESFMKEWSGGHWGNKEESYKNKFKYLRLLENINKKYLTEAGDYIETDTEIYKYEDPGTYPILLNVKYNVALLGEELTTHGKVLETLRYVSGVGDRKYFEDKGDIKFFGKEKDIQNLINDGLKRRMEDFISCRVWTSDKKDKVFSCWEDRPSDIPQNGWDLIFNILEDHFGDVREEYRYNFFEKFNVNSKDELIYFEDLFKSDKEGEVDLKKKELQRQAHVMGGNYKKQALKWLNQESKTIEESPDVFNGEGKSCFHYGKDTITFISDLDGNTVLCQKITHVELQDLLSYKYVETDISKYSPPFQEYLKEMFAKKNVKFIGDKQKIIDELATSNENHSDVRDNLGKYSVGRIFMKCKAVSFWNQIFHLNSKQKDVIFDILTKLGENPKSWEYEVEIGDEQKVLETGDIMVYDQFKNSKHIEKDNDKDDSLDILKKLHTMEPAEKKEAFKKLRKNELPYKKTPVPWEWKRLIRQENFNTRCEKLKEKFKYYALDWDDNLLYMPTQIIVETKDGNMGISTEEYTNVVRDYIIENKECELRGKTITGINEDTFKNFRTDGDSQFLEDLKTAKTGPAWEHFIEAVNNGRIFAIITARGHCPETLREATRILIESNRDGLNKYMCIHNLRQMHENSNSKSDYTDDELFDRYLEKLCKFYPTTFKNNEKVGDAHIYKVDAMRDFKEHVEKSFFGLSTEFHNNIKNNFVIDFTDDCKDNIKAINNNFTKKEVITTLTSGK